MRLDIQYKIKTVWHGGILCKRSNLFPVLSIRYQERGSRKWINLGKRQIDVYTYHRFKNTYYKDFKTQDTDIMTLESKSDYERMELFTEILNTEFHGNIDVYVRSIVQEHYTMSKVETEEQKDTSVMSCRLETDGWVVEQLIML